MYLLYWFYFFMYLFIHLLVGYSVVTISTWNATWQWILFRLWIWTDLFQNPPVSDYNLSVCFTSAPTWLLSKKGKKKRIEKQKERGPVKEPEAEWPDVLSAVLLRERRRKEMEKHDGGKEAKKKKAREEEKRTIRSCCSQAQT